MRIAAYNHYRLRRYIYNASNGNTYLFNASYATFNDAQNVCKDRGGHLVAWTSYKEQVG